MNPLRIASIDPIPDQRRGGQERSLYEILTYFSLKEHQVSLAYCEDGDLLPGYNQCNISTYPIKRTWIHQKSLIRQWIELFHSARSPAFLEKDILYINQYSDMPLACRIKKQRGMKLVCHLRLPPMQYGFQHKICIHHADQYIVATPKMRQAHIEFGWPGDKISVIPNGFSFPGDCPSRRLQSEKSFRIIYLGRITPAKGVELAIDLVEQLRSKQHNVQLDVYGGVLRDEHRSFDCELKTRCASRRLPVKFYPPTRTPLDTLPQYDLCIFPSQGDESFGRVPVESIMTGTPVIVNRIGSMEHIMGPDGQDWIFSNMDEAVEMTLRIINNSLCYPLKSIFQWMKNQYNYPKIFLQLEQLFYNVLEE